MPEQKMSISFRVDSGVIEHNNREIIAANVDPARINDNITYTQIDLRSFYHQLFDEALAEYNDKQNRADRKIPDYYEHIKKSGNTKLFYEVVVQFGDMQDCGLNSENWKTAQTMLNEYMQEFEKRNPNLKVFNAVMHLDESTPHLHIDFVPVSKKNAKGLAVKNSMSGALREQGFSSSNKMQNEWTAWSESERSYMEEVLHKHGLLRDDKNIHRGHLYVDEYKELAHQVQSLQVIQNRITELKKKNEREYTPEEITLIKNQNDFLRAEITKRNETISTLSKQAAADFIPVDLFSEDKLQYVADGLRQAKIPFVEENTTLYIPSYAVKTANAISSHYKPSEKLLSIREQTALDIDILVYSSESIDDLLVKLKKRGYEIKHGKYIAVKAPSAERYVRLKSLGDEYLPQSLERRIANRYVYTRKVQERMNKSSDIEKKVCAAILETTVAIRTFRITPKKTVQKKVYSYTNAANLNYLVKQLQTIGEFGLTSRESIYAKAQELQHTIHELHSHGDNADIQQNGLKRVKELIRAYEDIVEGNYIDSLIRKQKETKHLKMPT